MENKTNKENTLQSFIGVREWITIFTGILMIGVFSFTDIFSNPVSSAVYHLSQGIYLVCCFVYIFFKLAVKRKFQFVVTSSNLNNEEGNGENKSVNPKDSGAGNQKPENHEMQQKMEVREKFVEPFFIPIRILAILYIIVNISSAGFYFYNYINGPKNQIELKQSDLMAFENVINNKFISEKNIIDTINNHFPKQIFYSAGKVKSMKLDTTGAFVYYFKLNGLNKNLSVKEWQIKIFNFTDCKEKLFCSCDSTNNCLKSKTIELYYLLVTRKTKKSVKPDTLYYSRILNL